MSQWKLVFEDRFETDGQPNPEKWQHALGGHGWGNRESQVYTDSLENAFVKDGVLTIRALGNKQDGYTSARLNTYRKASFTYGRVEVEAKLPKGKGSWPAIWMLPDAIKEGKRWPLCGEIDIMEHVGRDENMVHVSLHSQKYNHVIRTQVTHFERLQDVFDTWHQYAMEWDENAIAFFYDGREVARFLKADRDQDEAGWPFDKPFHLIVNVAVGGNWGGEIDDSALPFEMKLRNLKVFEREV